LEGDYPNEKQRDTLAGTVRTNLVRRKNQRSVEGDSY
jgi:hypothetical protein